MDLVESTYFVLQVRNLSCCCRRIAVHSGRSKISLLQWFCYGTN